MKERLRQFMLGRYGMDHFGQLLTIISIIFILLGNFLSPLLMIGLVLFIYGYYRVLSRNIQKRSQENNAYNAFRYRITGLFSAKMKQFSQRKAYRFYRCPSCQQSLRVPKGKGNISITCSKCHTQFVRKS